MTEHTHSNFDCWPIYGVLGPTCDDQFADLFGEFGVQGWAELVVDDLVRDGEGVEISVKLLGGVENLP